MTMLAPRPDTAVDAANPDISHLDFSPPPITRADVVAAITAESGYNDIAGEALIAWFERLLAEMRSNQSDYYHLDDYDIVDIHPLLDLIMPDDSASRSGSAHDLLERYLLRPDEVALVHTKTGEEVMDCTVLVACITT